METRAKTEIIQLELPEHNLGRLRVLNLNATRIWSSETQQSQYKGCWVKGNDGAMYEVNISIVIDIDTLQLKSLKPYLRRVEIEGQNQ